MNKAIDEILLIEQFCERFNQFSHDDYNVEYREQVYYKEEDVWFKAEIVWNDIPLVSQNVLVVEKGARALKDAVFNLGEVRLQEVRIWLMDEVFRVSMATKITERKFMMKKIEQIENWCEPTPDGFINVPDELDPLINQIAFQMRLYTVSQIQGEPETVCKMVYAAQKFFHELYNKKLNG